ncbi:MAG: UDP-glucose 4-epimerase, partial [uncultured Thermomicrobiales bacterium]
EGPRHRRRRPRRAGRRRRPRRPRPRGGGGRPPARRRRPAAGQCRRLPAGAVPGGGPRRRRPGRRRDGRLRRGRPPRRDPRARPPPGPDRLRQQHRRHVRRAPRRRAARGPAGGHRQQRLRLRHGLGAEAAPAALRPDRRGAPAAEPRLLRPLEGGRRADGRDVPPPDRDGRRGAALPLGHHPRRVPGRGPRPRRRPGAGGGQCQRSLGLRRPARRRYGLPARGGGGRHRLRADERHRGRHAARRADGGGDPRARPGGRAPRPHRWPRQRLQPRPCPRADPLRTTPLLARL